VSGQSYDEEETAELAKTASFDKLRMSAHGEPVEPGVLRGSFRFGRSVASDRPQDLHDAGVENA
jgi:hypothetical protein